MTVIAWDGQVLAADKRGTQAGLVRTITKIERYGNQLLGVSGETHIGAEMSAWFKAGADPEKFPPKARDDEATLMVVREGQVWLYVTSPYPLLVEDRSTAIGSGRDFAIAAMALGLDAKAAVELASRFDAGCGNGVDTLTL